MTWQELLETNLEHMQAVLSRLQKEDTIRLLSTIEQAAIIGLNVRINEDKRELQKLRELSSQRWSWGWVDGNQTKPKTKKRK